MNNIAVKNLGQQYAQIEFGKSCLSRSSYNDKINSILDRLEDYLDEDQAGADTMREVFRLSYNYYLAVYRSRAAKMSIPESARAVFEQLQALCAE
ncbi:hypothetical protein KC887_00765 [Candidatus Kaiserbacteria bacterium]|nr:hypothetical protein [Candidatus Kaiserbacteria bacterium]